MLELSQSTDATMTEDLQDGYELIDAFCVDLGSLNEEGPAISRFKAAAAGDLVGELDGDSVSFTVEPETAYGCVFVNHLDPRGQRRWRDGDTGEHPPADRHVRQRPDGAGQRLLADPAGRDGRHPRQRPDPDPEPGDPPPVTRSLSPADEDRGARWAPRFISCPLGRMGTAQVGTDAALRASPTATNLTSPQSCRAVKSVSVGYPDVRRLLRGSDASIRQSVRSHGGFFHAFEPARACHASNRQPAKPRLAGRRTDAGRRPRSRGRACPVRHCRSPNPALATRRGGARRRIRGARA